MPAEAFKGIVVGNVGVSTEVVSEVSAATTCPTFTPSLELWLKSNSLMVARPIVEGKACWRPEAAPSSGRV